MTEEWIEHHGKGYPDLPMGTLVQVRFADDAEPEQNSVGSYSILWRHNEPHPHWADITHYRVVTP